MLAKNYFKGWYFKCSTEDKTIAFIPAFHKNHNKKSASLQIITDDSAFNLPFNSLAYSENPLSVKIGNCFFSEKGLRLDIQNKNLDIKGALRFYELSPIRYDIMGPFSYIPFMQCKHSLYSMKHRIRGQITINGKQLDFQNGTGYIEGDCGSSFPKEYIWTECSFENGALMLSVADIPMLGFNFKGIIGVVLINGKEYRIATYLGAKAVYIGDNTVIIKQGDYLLTAKLIKTNPLPLYAPLKGKMDRTIRESASSKAYYRFSYSGKTLCEFTSNKASFEFEMKKPLLM